MPVSVCVKSVPSQCRATPLLPTSHESSALVPKVFHTAESSDTWSGKLGSASHSPPCQRHAKPPIDPEAPPTAHTSSAAVPQMPYTVSVPGTSVLLNSPSS